MWATATGKRPDHGSVQFGPMYIFSPVAGLANTRIEMRIRE
jgi:hypothetical protein